jgi:SAM-dependent methyltransferase
MTYGFDKDFWERHWQQRENGGSGSMSGSPPNPYLARETSHLTPGTALDAGCGGGAEAIWLASQGWHVTAADISSEALARAAERAATSGTPRAATSGAPASLRWVEADLSVWSPARSGRSSPPKSTSARAPAERSPHDVVVRATRRR